MSRDVSPKERMVANQEHMSTTAGKYESEHRWGDFY